LCTGYLADVRRDYEHVRELHAQKKGPGELLSLEVARTRRFVGGANFVPVEPRVLGVQVLADYPLEDILPDIDWAPFFQAWDLAGKFPAILEDDVVGEAARSVWADAQKMVQKIIAEKWIRARAVYGIFPAASVDHDDIAVYDPIDRKKKILTWHGLRQQRDRGDGKPALALSDFVLPLTNQGAQDYVGLFAVNTGEGVEERAIAFEGQHDDYSAIMLKALADRFAEGFAEHLHKRIRREIWGYAPEESLSVEELIAEKYTGIRPAPGYPACPDHSVKRALFDVLDAEQSAGLQLTESLAMWPSAAVCGFYIANPEAHYFAVAPIGRDQLQDYARRRGVSLAEAERELSSVMA
jgi:5-methyltetrahydrofolate--homocysteine methyltransferase